MKTKKKYKFQVGRNSTTYFLLGIVIMLTLSYIMLESKTYNVITEVNEAINLLSEDEEDIPITHFEIPPPPPPPKQIVTQQITVVEDIDEVEETLVESTELGQDDVIEERVYTVEDVEVEEVEEEIEVPFSVIERVPVFPGCKGNNDELKACFQENMSKHLQRNFKYPRAAEELNISGKVYVMFIINKDGYITGIKSRGPDKLLEDEAERIISLLPKMEPGRQRNRPVSVPYSIPINFQLRK